MKKSITRDEWSKLILFLSILLGTFIRFNPTLLAGFPINDGGLFSVMIDDLRANHFLIPAFTTYNHLNIPYTYPPLGFYIGGIVVSLLGMNSIDIVRWFPAFFASLSIPAFYFLSLRLFKDVYKASISTMTFAFMPRAFFWFVMGGGLTRSTGLFFMLLTLIVVHRLYEEKRRADILWAGFLGGLVVMSHPESSVHTVLSAGLLWVMLSRKRIDFLRSVYVGLISMLVSAPWWGTVIFYHGLDPLRSALQTGGNSLSVFHLVFFSFTEEPYATVIAVVALIGIAHRLIRGDYLLPLWTAVPFFLAGRSATNLVVVPLAMLAAIGLGEVLLPSLQMSAKGEAKFSEQVSPVERNITIYLVLYLMFSAYQFGFQLSSASLHKSDLDAMSWVKANTPGDSSFLVLTGSTSVACDTVSEWFPALTDRQSLYTIQGHEWTLGEKFGSFISQAVDIQSCVNDTPSCLDEKAGIRDYDFVYLERGSSTNNCIPLEFDRDYRHFLKQMVADDRFNLVYENDGVMVFDDLR